MMPWRGGAYVITGETSQSHCLGSSQSVDHILCMQNILSSIPGISPQSSRQQMMGKTGRSPDTHCQSVLCHFSLLRKPHSSSQHQKSKCEMKGMLQQTVQDNNAALETRPSRMVSARNIKELLVVNMLPTFLCSPPGQQGLVRCFGV